MPRLVQRLLDTCMFFAHSLLGESDYSKWEQMHEHESLVAQYCSSFLKLIDPSLELWGELLGRWHDLGKCSEAFQNYLARQTILTAQLCIPLMSAIGLEMRGDCHEK